MSLGNKSKETVMTAKRFTTRKLVLVGLFSAISIILMVLEFHIPLTPPFLKLDFSELPVIMGGFILGPLAGFCIIAIKIGFKFIFPGTITMGVGELANLIGSVCYMLPAVWVYHKFKTKKGAAVALLTGTLVTSISAIFGNLFLIFPIYAKLFDITLDTIVEMTHVVNPYVHDTFTLMCYTMFPFNLLKYGVVSIIAFFVYKKLSIYLKNKSY